MRSIRTGGWPKSLCAWPSGKYQSYEGQNAIKKMNETAELLEYFDRIILSGEQGDTVYESGIS